jgi:hypothetical protein
MWEAEVGGLWTEAGTWQTCKTLGEKNYSKKGLGMTQVVGTVFKPQYYQKKKIHKILLKKELPLHFHLYFSSNCFSRKSHRNGIS